MRGAWAAAGGDRNLGKMGVCGVGGRGAERVGPGGGLAGDRVRVRAVMACMAAQEVGREI